MHGNVKAGDKKKEEEEEEKKKNQVEKEEEESSEEEEDSDNSSSSSDNNSSSSDSDSSSSSDSDSSSSDSSEEDSSSSSDSEEDSDDSSSEDEKAKQKEVKKNKALVVDQKDTKGKAKAPEVSVPAKGTKNKRTDEESAKEQASIQPEKKKPKQDSNTTAKVRSWREENHITVVNIDGGVENPTAPFAEFTDAPFPEYVRQSMKLFNFKKPTPIQAQSWPFAIKGQDIVGIAETGSGKTLAFGYPGIMKIKDLKKPVAGPKLLILAPTRELAQQIHDVMKQACGAAGLAACCVFGGVDKQQQSREIKNADVVTGTPGRLIDLIKDGSAKLNGVNYLVFDEADRMLDMGFIPQIRTIVENIPKERQTLMFSATWPVDVQKFAHTYLRNPVQVTIGTSGEKLAGAKRVQQFVEVINSEYERKPTIKKLLKKLCASEDKPRILVFMLYKRTCDAIYEELLREKWSVECLHGGKQQHVRDKSVDNFKKGNVNILIATDVAARGLDIKDIKYVVNGEMPLVMEDYIHRIGRTGRAGESGTAYTIFSPDDKVHARQLVRILQEGSHQVPAALAEICETAPVTKPRKSTMEQIYGDFARGVDAEQMMMKPTKITFD